MKSIKRSSAPHGGRLSLEQLEVRQVLSTGFQPTAAEQQFLEQLNDIRANPAAYGARIGLDLRDVAPAAPLAFNPTLVQAARHHSIDQNARGFFAHVTPEGVDAGIRLNALGFPWTSWGESLVGGGAYTTTESALAALIVDAGVSDLGHRLHLLAVDALFQGQNQVGVGIIQGGTGPLSNYYSVDTASSGDGRPFLLGVAYDDKNFNQQYDAGEGLGNVTLTIYRGDTATGPVVAQVATWDSGGYAVQLDPVATYTVVASGGGLTAPVTQTLKVVGENARLDFRGNSQAVPERAGELNAWVQMLYQDVLGRPATSAEVAVWTDQLLRGAGGDQVVINFLGSDEYARDQVTGWYHDLLRRAPDAASLDALTLRVRGADNPKAVLTDLLASSEYYAVTDATPQGFVHGLYADLLGRAPAGSEASAWINQAAQGDRRGVIAGVLASNEYNQRVVAGYYRRYLRRDADAAGSALFVNHMAHGGDERVVIDHLLISAEYFRASRATIWVQRLYQDLLSRNATATDIAGWVSRLREGATRTEVATAIAASAEAQLSGIDGLFRGVLDRETDEVGQDSLGRFLRAGGGLGEAASNLASSDEYYALQGGTDADFVRGLYADLLKRPASSGEVDYWSGRLNGDLSRAALTLQLVRSDEYRQMVVYDLSMKLLGRTPYADEVTKLVEQMRQGGREYDVAGRLAASDEYFLAGAG